MFFEFLTENLSLQVAALVGVVYAAFKYRRIQAWAGLFIGAISTAGTLVLTLTIGGAVAVAAGWLEPAAVVSDVITWGSGLWGMVRDPLLEAIRGFSP